MKKICLLCACLLALIFQSCNKDQQQKTLKQVKSRPKVQNAFGWTSGQPLVTGTYVFIKPNTYSICLYPSTNNNGSSIIAGTFNGWDATNQEWNVENLGDSTYKITNNLTGLALDVPGANMNDVPLNTWTPNNNNNQRWKIESTGGSLYRLKSVQSGKVVTLGSNNVISQTGEVANDAHRWIAVQVPALDKTVVLTFDDASRSHIDIVAPMLKKFGYNATFYVCEYPNENFETSPNYMRWIPHIQTLSQQGYEIGNHTWQHANVSGLDAPHLLEQVQHLEQICSLVGIPIPTTFAYPGYVTSTEAASLLQGRGYKTARAGGNIPYTRSGPGANNPYYAPSFDMAGNSQTLVQNALAQAGPNKTIIFTIHGAPDTAHPNVGTDPFLLYDYLKYLAFHRFKVITMKEMAAL